MCNLWQLWLCQCGLLQHPIKQLFNSSNLSIKQLVKQILPPSLSQYVRGTRGGTQWTFDWNHQSLKTLSTVRGGATRYPVNQTVQSISSNNSSSSSNSSSSYSFAQQNLFEQSHSLHSHLTHICKRCAASLQALCKILAGLVLRSTSASPVQLFLQALCT